MQISQGVNICCPWDFIVCELSDYCYWFLYRQMVCQITFWHTTLETCGSVDIYKRDKFFIKNTQRYKLFKQLKCHLFSCKLRLNFPEGKGCVQKEAKQYCNQEQLDSSNFLTSPSASIFMPEKCNLLNSLCCIDCINCTILTKILTQRPSQLPGKNAQSTRQTVKFAPFVMLVTFPSSTCGDCGRSAVSYKHSGVVFFFFSFFVRSSIM